MAQPGAQGHVGIESHQTPGRAYTRDLWWLSVTPVSVPDLFYMFPETRPVAVILVLMIINSQL